MHFQGYYTVSTQCVYNLTDPHYIDQATLRTSSSRVWCECDVIGIYRGQLIELSTPIPAGLCVLTVTRCPFSSNILP